MGTFTSSLPDHLLHRLAQEAENLKVPKNKIIQKALERYLEQLDKAAFLKSYKQMGDNPEILQVAEEGIEDWFKILNEYDNE